MFNLKQVSISVATIALPTVVSALVSTPAQAAIISGQVTGTWDYDYDGVGGFNVGDTFTADYTFDSSSVTTTDYSDPTQYSRYFYSSVPLLSLVLNSGSISHSFDWSTGGYGVLVWDDLQSNPAYYGQYRYISTSLQAYDFSAPGYNYFSAYSQVGRYSDGSPFAAFSAQAYSYDYSTGTYPTNGLTDSQVNFSTPAPTAIPTPALLPGLVGFGVGVLRKRKQAGAVTAKSA